ncbi:MAG: DUF4199 domain-containing protein [Bacteroidetes bacterium]|nr:DUF4199 domain-containing protein [Bacteroidota bacterium]
MYKLAMRWGLITGVLSFAWLIGEFIFGLHTTHVRLHPYITNFAMLIPIVCSVIATKQIRTQVFQGSATFKELLRHGLAIAVIATACGIAGQLIYHLLVNPNYFTYMIDVSKQIALEKKEDLTKAENFAKDYFTLKNYLAQIFFGGLVIGTLLAVIMAAIFKNKK